MTTAVGWLVNGGGGSGGSVPSANSITEESVFAALDQTNLKSRGFYDLGPPATRAFLKNKIKHWHHDPEMDVLIPVKISNTIFVVEALNRIESKMGFKLFDRVSIENTPDEDIHYGLIFRQGTAVGPDGEPDEYNCGNTGAKDGSPRYVDDWQGADGAPKVAISVNIGSSIDTPFCTLDVGLVIHEIQHALGMMTHFDFFGRGENINHENDMAYSVLYNLYTNDLLTPSEEVKITLPYK